MGHMLRSVNSEAADQIEQDRAPLGTPGIAEWVVFHPRPGERRMSRTSFPALVMWQHKDGRLDLLIVYDANDVVLRQGVRKATDAEPTNAWSLTDVTREVEPFEPSRLNAMTRETAFIRAFLMGPHDNEFVLPQGESIMSVLDGFGRRITALERGVAPSRKGVGKAK